jgi:uncharacterized protein (UPF0333 family)
LGRLEARRINNRGQFSIIAALLVAVILIATVIVTYSTIRNNPIQTQPQMLSAIDETNLAIKQILGFTVGYYGSVLQVTGNSSYAKMLALNYLQSGLVNIANMHPEWGPSFLIDSSNLGTYWFTNTSYSTGDLGMTYNLTGLGISGIAYHSSSKLSVGVLNATSTTQACLNVTKDEDEPLINLGKSNFKFYNYTYSNSSWVLVSPVTEPTAFANGTYLIDIPSGVDPYSYVVQVEDSRGIIVVASSFSHYTLKLTWNSTMYSKLPDATLVMELWQNGTMRWLGQDLQLTTQAKPIPPIAVKALHVNQTTTNGTSSEVPFQVEDWTSEYRIPLGLTNNASVFSSRTMLVFLINSNISKVLIWWNGSDAAVQTPLAYTNKYFTVDTVHRTLSNGNLNLTLDFSSQDGVESFKVISTSKTSTATAVLMRINNKIAQYGSSEPMYAVVNGTVRVVLQHEVEWGGGITDCSNVYAHIVLTLPANVTYYTYQLRLMFMESTKSRTITDICPIRLKGTIGQPLTENGTSSGYPVTSSTTDVFYNLSTYWAHHWSQFNSTTTKGFGIMFTNNTNQNLYIFDSKAGNKTGALNVSTPTGEKRIEFSPVTALAKVSNFTSALDIIWYGAVVTFDGGTPIYKSGGTGLWIIVEYPPTVAVTTES